MRKSGQALLVLVQAEEGTQEASPHKLGPALTDAYLAAVQAEVSTGVKRELEQLLERYQDVFETLDELPPERNVGHPTGARLATTVPQALPTQ